MFTPQEIQDRVEGLEKAIFGGYSVSSVEELLTPLQEDYAALYDENATLKSKLKILAEKVEKYRAQEDNIKKTLLKAQSAADEMVSAAERKSARMLSDSEQRLRQRSHELAAEVLAEQERATMAKETTARFIVELEERIQAQMLELEKIKALDLAPLEGASAPKVAQRGERRAATRPPAQAKSVAAEDPVQEPAPVQPSEAAEATKTAGAPSHAAEKSVQQKNGAMTFGDQVSRMIEASVQTGEAADSLGDTRVIHPTEP